MHMTNTKGNSLRAASDTAHTINYSGPLQVEHKSGHQVKTLLYVIVATTSSCFRGRNANHGSLELFLCKKLNTFTLEGTSCYLQCLCAALTTWICKLAKLSEPKTWDPIEIISALHTLSLCDYTNFSGVLPMPAQIRSWSNPFCKARG